MDKSFRGKCAIVTGAASGIGKAVAEALTESGAEVIGFDLNVSNAAFDVIFCDVSSESFVSTAVAEAMRRLGTIDILVNCAGIQLDADLADLDVAILDKMYAVNLRGPILVMRACLPHFREGARVINLASELARLGRSGSSAYSATKGAILSLTRSWAREFAPRILVNAVAPGPTDTPLLHFDTLSPAIQALELSNPLGRIGKAQEIAEAILFLAGPGASFMTGQCIGVDGGAAMR
ncbi:MAG TPA: SDR family oxidoreductase [Terriglobia bacterium]|nr:SDR family oxidoreductase [Terriglobia bacterium]